MPKDPSKNVDRYKIRGGTLNEFEYTENQGALAGQKPKSQANLIPGTPPEERDGPRPVVVKSTKKRTTKTTKAAKSKKATKTVATRGASAKKLAARKAAKKK